MNIKTAKEGVYYLHLGFPFARYVGIKGGNLIVCKTRMDDSISLGMRVVLNSNFWKYIFIDPDQTKHTEISKNSKKWLLTYTGNMPNSNTDVFCEFSCATRKIMRDFKKMMNNQLFGKNNENRMFFKVTVTRK